MNKKALFLAIEDKERIRALGPKPQTKSSGGQKARNRLITNRLRTTTIKNVHKKQEVDGL